MAPSKLSSLAALVIFAAFSQFSQSAQAATAFITFDDLPQGPSLFSQASPVPQTIVYPQATFTGGVVLGLPTAFPQQGFATSPNLYGTCSCAGLETLTITITSFPTTEVSFPVFNGQTFTQGYTVTAFDASNAIIGSQDLANVPSNGSSNGFAVADLITATDIASITITPDGSPGSWDFFVDSVALNESVQTAVGATPLPAALPLFASGLGAMGLFGWRRKRKTAAIAA